MAATDTTSDIDPAELRKTLGCFLTGVTVVTTQPQSAAPRGFTANSFTSVSLDPPLILVCLDRRAESFPVFQSAEHFAVNMLAEDQRDVSGLFASKRPDKFEGLAWRPGPGGSPLIEGSHAWIDCAMHDRVEAGDHVLLIGRVIGFGRRDATPLGYHSGHYIKFGLERLALEATQDQAAQVNGLFEKDGALLFVEEEGALRLPKGTTLGESKHEKGSLFHTLDQLGVDAAVNFIYSVAHDPHSDRVHLTYRGEIHTGPDPDNTAVHMVPMDDIPWDRLLTRPNQRVMIERYVRERSEERLGVFFGTFEGGTIHSLA